MTGKRPKLREGIPDDMRVWTCAACGRFGPTVEDEEGCKCSLADKIEAWAGYVATSPDVRRDMERTAAYLRANEGKS